MKSFKEIMEESKRIDKEMEKLLQSIGYKDLEEASKDAEETLKLILCKSFSISLSILLLSFIISLKLFIPFTSCNPFS